MKISDVVKRYFVLLTIFIIGVFFAGCSIIGGIFKAGVWVGIIVVVIILMIVFYLMSKFRK